MRDWSVEGRALLFGVGNQFVEGDWVEASTGEDVSADLAGFFNYANTKLFALLGGELFGANGCGEAGGAAA